MVHVLITMSVPPRLAFSTSLPDSVDDGWDRRLSPSEWSRRGCASRRGCPRWHAQPRGRFLFIKCLVFLEDDHFKCPAFVASKVGEKCHKEGMRMSRNIKMDSNHGHELKKRNSVFSGTFTLTIVCWFPYCCKYACCTGTMWCCCCCSSCCISTPSPSLSSCVINVASGIKSSIQKVNENSKSKSALWQLFSSEGKTNYQDAGVWFRRFEYVAALSWLREVDNPAREDICMPGHHSSDGGRRPWQGFAQTTECNAWWGRRKVTSSVKRSLRLYKKLKWNRM